MTRLRVASYNVRALQDDVGALVRTIRAIDPDVLCVQEIPRFWPIAMRVTDLARRTGLVWAGRETRSGQTSILTSPRVRTLQVSHHRLPTVSRLDARGFAIARVAPFGGSPVSVASVHLSLDPAERVRHARTILDVLSSAGDPMLVGGDLNEQEDGPAWALLTERLRPVSVIEATYPSWGPDRVLDAILASPDLTAHDHAPVQLVAQDLVAGTDHLPIWVDVTTP
ncbi:endonuclease/exonuclease/phosphatase family protein [Janibacter sp. GXQ6167]|uniref:endonuclease/exonuclease/phosphatase family protein n=1 Tax=Janibacter sp. GXQ6167 TaxID=3240791 RepID=UPI003525F505